MTLRRTSESYLPARLAMKELLTVPPCTTSTPVISRKRKRWGSDDKQTTVTTVSTGMENTLSSSPLSKEHETVAEASPSPPQKKKQRQTNSTTKKKNTKTKTKKKKKSTKTKKKKTKGRRRGSRRAPHTGTISFYADRDAYFARMPTWVPGRPSLDTVNRHKTKEDAAEALRRNLGITFVQTTTTEGKDEGRGHYVLSGCTLTDKNDTVVFSYTDTEFYEDDGCTAIQFLSETDAFMALRSLSKRHKASKAGSKRRVGTKKAAVVGAPSSTPSSTLKSTFASDRASASVSSRSLFMLHENINGHRGTGVQQNFTVPPAPPTYKRAQSLNCGTRAMPPPQRRFIRSASQGTQFDPVMNMLEQNVSVWAPAVIPLSTAKQPGMRHDGDPQPQQPLRMEPSPSATMMMDLAPPMLSGDQPVTPTPRMSFPAYPSSFPSSSSSALLVPGATGSICT